MNTPRPVKPDPVQWGRRHALAAPAWSDATFYEACAALGIRMEFPRR